MSHIDKGRKIPAEEEAILERPFLFIAEHLTPIFKKLGHTPNMVTTYSLIVGLIGIACLAKDIWVGIFICIPLSYLLDDVDGMLARRYKMTSKFGALYDDCKDIFLTVSFALFTVYKVVNHFGVFNGLILTTLIYGVSVYAEIAYLYCYTGNDEKYKAVCEKHKVHAWFGHTLGCITCDVLSHMILLLAVFIS